MKHLFLDVSVCAMNAVLEAPNELMKGQERIKMLLSLLYAIVGKYVRLWLLRMRSFDKRRETPVSPV
jgi:hypothetical protein